MLIYIISITILNYEILKLKKLLKKVENTPLAMYIYYMMCVYYVQHIQSYNIIYNCRTLHL